MGAAPQDWFAANAPKAAPPPPSSGGDWFDAHSPAQQTPGMQAAIDRLRKQNELNDKAAGSSLIDQARASYANKNGNVEMPGSFEGHPEHIAEYPVDVATHAKNAVTETAKGNFARGGHEAFQTLSTAAQPMLPIVAAGAPIATARTLVGGYVGGKLAETGAEKLGATPDQAAFAGDVGNVVGGGLANAKVPDSVLRKTGDFVERNAPAIANTGAAASAAGAGVASLKTGHLLSAPEHAGIAYVATRASLLRGARALGQTLQRAGGRVLDADAAESMVRDPAAGQLNAAAAEAVPKGMKNAVEFEAKPQELPTAAQMQAVPKGMKNAAQYEADQALRKPTEITSAKPQFVSDADIHEYVTNPEAGLKIEPISVTPEVRSAVSKTVDDLVPKSSAKLKAEVEFNLRKGNLAGAAEAIAGKVDKGAWSEVMDDQGWLQSMRDDLDNAGRAANRERIAANMPEAVPKWQRQAEAKAQLAAQKIMDEARAQNENPLRGLKDTTKVKSPAAKPQPAPDDLTALLEQSVAAALAKKAKVQLSAGMGNSNTFKLYHGTTANFDRFQPSSNGRFGPGIYLTDSPEGAAAYANTGRDNFLGTRAPKEGANVRQVEARLENPLRIKERSSFQDRGDYETLKPLYKKFGVKGPTALWEAVRKAGHDGIIFTDADGLKEYVVFSPEQLK